MLTLFHTTLNNLKWTSRKRTTRARNTLCSSVQRNAMHKLDTKKLTELKFCKDKT